MYVDLNTIQTYNSGDILTAAALQQIRANGEYLIDPPAASVYNSAVQSVPNDTATVLTADSESYDNDSMHSTSTNTSRITIQTAGRYLLLTTVRFAANATGRRTLVMRVNGSTLHPLNNVVTVGAAEDTIITSSRSLVLSAADYVEVRCYQNSGGNLDVTLTEFAALFMTR